MTALDVLAILFLQHRGFRYLEALVVGLILLIGGCFLAEVIFSKPALGSVLNGFIPRLEVVRNPDMLYLAISIIGATVMPHNLYLHSSIVQTRKYEQSASRKREAIKFPLIPSTLALPFPPLINPPLLF